MRELEQQVLNTYTTVSPSHTSADTQDEWNALIKRRDAVVQRRLHLLPQLFEGRTLLDLGCGTGEYTAYYAHLGANVTGVDFNPVSLKRMEAFFDHHELKHKLVEVIETSVSEWSPEFEAYDICVSDGVLHHLSNPQEGFHKLCSTLRPGGIIYICVGTTDGAIQRDTMRQIILKYADGLDEAVALSMELFSEYIERAVTYGHRTAEQVVNDNFLVEQNVRHSIEELMAWFREENITLQTTWPVLQPNVAEPVTADVIDWTTPDNAKQLAKHARPWAYSTLSISEILQTGDMESYFIKTEEKWDEEIIMIQTLIAKDDLDGLRAYLPNCEVFGRGYSGLGDAQFVGVKKR
jgi:SAM-dependent methyltransferase